MLTTTDLLTCDSFIDIDDISLQLHGSQTLYFVNGEYLQSNK